MFSEIKVGDVVTLVCRDQWKKSEVVEVKKRTFKVNNTPWLFRKTDGDVYGGGLRSIYVIKYDEEKFNAHQAEYNKRMHRKKLLAEITSAPFTKMSDEKLEYVLKAIKC